MARAFDETELLDRIDNDMPFLAETVEMLSSDGRGLMTELHRAIDAGESSATGRFAHALKGMLSNFCAPEAQQSALEVELLGKSGDLTSAPAAARTLEQNLEALIGELQRSLQERQ